MTMTDKAFMLEHAPFVGDPWERQAKWKESPQAYVGFCLYRDLDPGTRTLTEAAHQYAENYNRSARSSVVMFSRWAKQYRWNERSTAYDNMMDAKEVAVRKKVFARRTKLHYERMAQAEELLMEPLKKYEERLRKVAEGLATSQFDEYDDDGNPIISDVELLAIGRATIKTVMDLQKEERTALQAPIPEIVNTQVTSRRAAVLQRIFKTDGAPDQLERLAFAIAEDVAEVESTG